MGKMKALVTSDTSLDLPIGRTIVMADTCAGLLHCERVALSAQLAEAVDRIKDMLQGDDGQAWKEAERFLEKIGAADSTAEQENEGL